MVQRDDITTPQLERGDAFSPSPSPARDALQCNLDTTLTLTRKKSGWFGSARETLARGALSAKGYIDSIRGEGSVRGEDDIFEDRSEAILNEETSIGHEEDTSSITPLRPHSERQRGFTPKTAMTSLRQHVQMGSKARSKRGALAEITGNAVHNPIEGADGPEHFMSDDGGTHDTVVAGEVNDPPIKGHGRKSSLGRSLVGSIRRMARSPRNDSPSRGRSRLSPTKVAAEVPLPSSPIDIPAPSLSLDLGSGDALVPFDFGRSPPETRAEELMKMTDPKNVMVKNLSAYHARVPFEGSLHDFSKGDFGPVLPDSSTPTTPMPGTDFAFELDGAKSETRPELFERSVGPAAKKDRSLRKMVSLDAIAKQGKNSLLNTTNQQTLLEPTAPLCLRRQSSMTTIDSCPTDMPNLTRQLAKLQDPDAGHRNPIDGEWKSDDPFAPGNVVGDIAARTPSPGKDVELPFRPKIVMQAVGDVEPSALIVDEAPRDGQATVFVPSMDHPTIATAEDVQGVNPRPVYQSVAEELHALKSRTNFRDSELSGSDDFKTRYMFPALVDLYDAAQYEDAQATDVELDVPPSATTEDSSQSAVQLMSNLYARISSSQTPSPGRTRASTTHSADVGDMFWNFAVRDWVHAGGADLDSSTPQETTPPMLDVEDHDEESRPSDDFTRQTPEVSPAVSSPGIGSRLSFELKRSDRNMRYNALHSAALPGSDDSFAANERGEIIEPLRPNLKFVTGSLPNGSLPNGSKSNISLVGYVPKTASDEDDVVCKSGEASPKSGRRNDSITQTDEDLERSLQQAIVEHYQFQVAMAGMGMGEEYGDLTDLEADEHAAGPEFGVKMGGEGNLLSDDVDPFEGKDAGFRGLPGPTDNDVEGLPSESAEALEPDTLDEALEMFRTYSHSQQELHEDLIASENDMEDDGGTLDSLPDGDDGGHQKEKEIAVGQVTPGKKCVPSRYRSQRGRG